MHHATLKSRSDHNTEDGDPSGYRGFCWQDRTTYRRLRTRELTAKPSPKNAPNIFVIMFDDVSFGSCSTFGGPVPTPAWQRVADRGLRYNQFHTTALR